MYSRGIRVYGRGLAVSTRPGSETEDIADQLFGKASSKPLPRIGPPPEGKPSPRIEPLRSSLPSTSYRSDPFVAPLPYAKRLQGRHSKIKVAGTVPTSSSNTKDSSGEEDANASNEDINDREWRSDRTASSIKSGESYKRRRKNNKASSETSSVSAKKRAKPARRKKPPSADVKQEMRETKSDPFANDPLYEKFMEEYMVIKAIDIPVEDEEEYFLKSKAAASKEFAEMISSQSAKHTAGYSMITSNLRKASRLHATTRMSKLASIEETGEWTNTTEGEVESTPLAARKKAHFDLSGIDEMSPLTAAKRNRTVHPPERKSNKSPLEQLVEEAPEGHPLVSTPVNNHRPRRGEVLDISRVQEVSPIMKVNNISADLADAEEESNLSKDVMDGHAATSRKTDKIDAMELPATLSTRATTSKRNSPLARHVLNNSPGKTLGASNHAKKLRRSSQQSFVAPLSPPPLSRTRRRRMTTVEISVNVEPENVLRKTSFTDVTRENLGNTRKIPPQTPLASQSILPRRRGESLALFSPAFQHNQSHEERSPNIQSATLSSRKSVVFDANDRTLVSSDEQALLLILEISTPNRLVNMKHILGEDYADLVKIGEGSFADVYSVMMEGRLMVLKIVPVAGFSPDGSKQTSFQDILGEAIISRILTTHLTDESAKDYYAPVFARTLFIKVARGPYPAEFWSLHDSFSRENEDAINPSPASYPPDQVFVIIGCENGGKALDAFPVANYSQAKSIFQQVAMGFAIAEKSLEFEHRDAHIGNILVQLTHEDEITFLFDKQAYKVPSFGVKVSIIDWTLSRIRNGSKTVYKDLSAEKTIFEGSGDYQFDVYRQMRDSTDNDWQVFRPQTNVHWLQYLHHIFIESNEKKLKATVKDRHAKKVLSDLSEAFRKYDSTMELISKERMFQSCKA